MSASNQFFDNLAPGRSRTLEQVPLVFEQPAFEGAIPLTRTLIVADARLVKQ